MNKMKNKILNFLRIVRGYIVRTIRPKSNYFLFKAPERNLKPASIMYGFDRGTPVDRYYIEAFLEENKEYIKGVCLEITDNQYTEKFGGNRVTKSDVLDIDTNNKEANIYGDMRNLDMIESNTYDCLIITQTYVMIDDFHAAVKECFRILKPGGTLLVTMPCLSPVWNIKNHCWRFTVASSEYTFGKHVTAENLLVKSYGNVLSGQAFWVGMAIQDLTKEELDYNDQYFPVIIGTRAIKSS